MTLIRIIAESPVPEAALGWVTQVAAAAAVVFTTGMFLIFLWKFGMKLIEALSKLITSLDKNTEALGRADAVADRWDRFLDSKGIT